jgi:hypothetical protein
MLTDEEKQRIREEEIFRREARRQLEADQPSLPSRTRIWQIVNSSIVLWFLSSIVLGLFGWGHAKYQEHLQQRELRRRLNTELAYRMTESLVTLSAAQARVSRGDPDRPDSIYLMLAETLDGYDRKTKSRIKGTYADYQERGFQSLVVELQGLSAAGDRPELTSVSEAYVMLKIDAMNVGDFSADDDPARKREKSKQALENAGRYLQGMASRLSRLSGQVAPPGQPPA